MSKHHACVDVSKRSLFGAPGFCPSWASELEFGIVVLMRSSFV